MEENQGAPKDIGQENRRQSVKINQYALPVDWEFGQIKEINPKTYMVRVIIFREGLGDTTEQWHPIIKGQDTIRTLQEQYGKITDGMCCIVWWRGDTPKTGKTFIQIIGKGPGCGGETMITEKEPVSNELATGPSKVVGGMIQT